MGGPEQRQRIWPLIVAVIAEIPANFVVFFVVFEIVKQNGLLPVSRLSTVGCAAAAILVVAFCAWLILYFATLRGAGWRRSLGHFLVLLVALVVAYAILIGIGVWVSKYVAPKQREADIETALSEAANAEHLAAAHADGSVDLHTTFPGDAGLITRSANRLLQDVPLAYSNFADRLSDLDYDRAMSPARIGAKDGFAATRRTLRQVRAAMADRNQQIDSAMARYRATIAGIAMDPGVRKATLARMDRVFAENRSRRAAEADALDALLDEQETTIDDLELSRGKWKIVGNRFTFDDEDAYSTYRAHIRKLISLSHDLSWAPH